MNIVRSNEVQPVEGAPKIAALLETIAEDQLREWVQRISVPRHFTAELEQNQATADWLCRVIDSMGHRVERQGEFANVVALPRDPGAEVILVGAHYDSVPGCPGADDNGSAVAAMLGCAAACSRWQRPLPVMFIAFNREEDNLLGSRDFVESYLPTAGFAVRCAHILEMVGYASPAPGSQRVPTGLPIKIRDKGDFLGLLANSRSSKAMDHVLHHAGAYVPGLPVIGLHVKLGLERYFPVLARSDHVPFWKADIPAVMWTDTSEFRNGNYHQPTDTPNTLDYRFLRSVSRLLAAAVIAQAEAILDRDL